ncbi:spore germination protein [Sedimentibacter acidaminivorans]|jgi:spore germination protein YaaH|uniref:Spore germination protein n=1 Tax=Sedimentibacter acidaminivorans TaxID=913099 RepID=A0ABS4GHT1_9FIRM|nr:glycosyl hydrolase family 18 protein [Sedimentibacter acidaminivorans]MBP1927102.1 spore germination protein [Sedimentibacter acidaminivorans]
MFNIRASQYGPIIVNGYAYPFINQWVFQQWTNNLTYASSFSYGFTQNGDLIPLFDESLILNAYRNGVAPLMVITPLDEEGKFSNELASIVLNNVAARNRLINNIYNTVLRKDYYGVDFDFEFLFPDDADEYVLLVSQMRERLNEIGAVTLVALAPKTYTEQPGLLYEGHDYKGLGEAADLALLMTYEWGYTYGPPMAVAPINNVRKVLEYGITQIPPEKILMGIPNYGYDWTLPYVQGQSVAENLSIPEAIARADGVGAQIQYDEIAQTPFYEYIDAQGRQHVVWFEDERSLRAKLELVNEYGLAGVSFWTVMDPFPAASVLLNQMFNVVKVI